MPLPELEGPVAELRALERLLERLEAAELSDEAALEASEESDEIAELAEDAMEEMVEAAEEAAEEPAKQFVSGR